MTMTAEDVLGPADDPLDGQGELFDRDFCATWRDQDKTPDPAGADN